MEERTVRLRLFGGFELDIDGVVIDVPPSSQRLLGFLALQERPQTRAHVGAVLWSDTTDERAAANLRTAVWRLHRPELPLVDTAHGHLALATTVWSDVRALRTAARRLRQHGLLPVDDLLLDLRGDLLPGCWDGWAVDERERLRLEYAHLCERACLQHLHRDDGHRSVLYALAAVQCDPLRESANALLVQAHVAAGNRSSAIRHARAYAVLLHDELGIDPPSDVADLAWTRPTTLGVPA